MDREILTSPDHKGKVLFGRKWKISVLVPIDENETSSDWNSYVAYVLADSDKEDQSLRVTFKIQNYGWQTPNFSEIAVYNLSPQMENLLIDAGTRIVVEAGYKNGNFGVIYDGSIFQALWEREGTINSKVTFRCIDAMDIIYDNHVSLVESLKHQKEQVLSMAAKSRRPFKIQTIADTFKNIELARAKVFFDSPMYYIRKFAQQSGTVPSTQRRDVYLVRPQDPVPESVLNQALVLSTKTGLIGLPQQTQEGINCTCLLNPSIMVFCPEPMMVKIDSKEIRQLHIQYNSPGFSRLDEDGVYKVLGVDHVGDTRGTDWYTHITGTEQSMQGTMAATYKTLHDVET